MESTASYLKPMEVEDLWHVLMAAYDQCAWGKGMTRHGSRGLPLMEQPMGYIVRTYGRGFAYGQVAKKMQEAERLVQQGHHAKAREELLGAIVYLGAAVLDIERAISQLYQRPAPED